MQRWPQDSALVYTLGGIILKEGGHQGPEDKSTDVLLIKMVPVEKNTWFQLIS